MRGENALAAPPPAETHGGAMECFPPDSLDIFVCPDTHASLRAGEKHSLVGDGTRPFPVDDGIIYLLPDRIANGDAKTAEREGWRTVFERRGWDDDGESILALPWGGGGVYWPKAALGFDMALAALAPLAGKRGLDAACGIGWAAAQFARRGARMIAADFNDTQYNGLRTAIRARDRGVRFDAVCCDSETLPVADSSLDFVFVGSALHHMTRPRKALSEYCRILKPGGMLVVICESFRTGWFDARRDSTHELLGEFRDAGINEQAYAHGEYMAMFRGAGFQTASLFVDWDAPLEGRPPEEWVNSGLDRAASVARRPVRFALRRLRFPFVVSALRAARFRWTVAERVFLARKSGT